MTPLFLCSCIAAYLDIDWPTFWRIEWMRFQVGCLYALLVGIIVGWIYLLLWLWPRKDAFARRCARWLSEKMGSR